jgi:hypothetical protein
MSSEDVVVRVDAGVTRVSIGSNSEPDVHDQEEQELSRVHGGAFQFDSRTGEVRSGEFSQAQVSPTDFNSGKGILATARTKSGAPVREITGDTLVTVEGIETELRQLEGTHVRRNENGRWEEIPAAERQQQSQQSEEQGDGAGGQELFPHSIEVALAHVAEGADLTTFTPLMIEHAIKFGETGTLSVNIEEVVSRTGLPRERAEAYTTLVRESLAAQVRGELAKDGIDPAAFMGWALQNRPEEFKAAVVNQVNVRSLNGYRELAAEFMRETVPTEAALKAAGWQTKQDSRSNQLLVNYKGTWMAAAAAARSGLI